MLFTRQLTVFAQEKPYLASYAATVLFFATVPLLGLLLFVVVLVVVLLAALLFWVGFALVVTAGVLIVAATMATGAYVYFLSLFMAGRWAKNTFMGAGAAVNLAKGATNAAMSGAGKKVQDRVGGSKAVGDGGVRAGNGGAKASGGKAEKAENRQSSTGDGNAGAEKKQERAQAGGIVGNVGSAVDDERQKLKKDIARSLS